MLIKLAVSLAVFCTFNSISFAQGINSTIDPIGGTVSALDPIASSNRGWNDAYKLGRTGDRLLGDVSFTANTLPWDPIVVAVKCNGKIAFATKTSPNGQFIIARPIPLEASTMIGKEKAFVNQFIGCTVSAVLPGFHSSELTIANRDLFTTPQIGTIKLTHDDGATGSAISSTTLSAPKEARKLFQKARNEWLNDKPDRAQRELKKVLEIDPRFAEAWYQLGRIQRSLKSPDALHSFTRAAEADTNFVLPYEQMAPLAAQAGAWQELLEETSRALELNPSGNLDVWHYHALANYQLKRLDLAEKSALNSLSLDPLHLQPDTEQLLAVILMAKHDRAGALQHLRSCLAYFPPGPNLDLVKRQIALLESSESEKPVAVSESVSDSPIPPEPDVSPSSSSNASCPLEDVLPKVTLHSEEFVQDVERFSATEDLLRERLDRNGIIKDKSQSSSNYVATIQKLPSELFAVSEYRDELQRPGSFHGTISANVAPALVLIFHPSHIGEFFITCNGLSEWLGHKTWRVDFRQRRDRPATMSGLEVGSKEFTVLLKGSAWIDRENYQIVHLETDLLQPIPELKLQSLHQSVDYSSVAYNGGKNTLWLPQTAEVTVDLQGKRLLERHNYSNFQVFSVNTHEKINQLVDSPH